MSARPLLVVAGIGAGNGTGGATARVFAKAGYAVALIARGQDSLNKLADEINKNGGKAAGFPISEYSSSELKKAFTSISSTFSQPEYVYRVALFNAGSPVWNGFLDLTEDDVHKTIDNSFFASWHFSQEVIRKFKESPVDEEKGVKGTLLFTGNGYSVKGGVTTAAFSAGKHASRALSQSLAKEFGKNGIHVSHVIVDGGIDGPYGRHLPDGLKPQSIAQSYFWLANQDKSAWTWEIDLRPSVEKW